MSYILDALRKADAERERDPARGIHAQPAITPPVASALRRWGWPVGVAGGLALGVIVAALWRAEPSPGVTPAGRPVVAHAPPATPGPAPVVGMPALPGPLPVATPAQAVQPAPPPMERPVPPPAVTAPTVARTASAPLAAPPVAVAPAATPVAPDRILAIAELPPDLLRELPRLAISGGVYSDNPAQRMLIVGGQVVNEGAELAPGLRLEEIRARTAVLRFRNYRYSVAY